MRGMRRMRGTSWSGEWARNGIYIPYAFDLTFLAHPSSFSFLEGAAEVMRRILGEVGGVSVASKFIRGKIRESFAIFESSTRGDPWES